MKRISLIVFIFAVCILASCTKDMPVSSNIGETEGIETVTTGYAFLARFKVQLNGDSVANYYWNFDTNYTHGDTSSTVTFKVPGKVGTVTLNIVESVAWAMPNHQGLGNAQVRYCLWQGTGNNLLTGGLDTLNIPNFEHDARGYTKKSFTLTLNCGQYYKLQLGRGTRVYSPPYAMSLVINMVDENGHYTDKVFEKISYFEPGFMSAGPFPFHTGKKLDGPKNYLNYYSTVTSGHTIFADSGYKGRITISNEEGDANVFEFKLFDRCTKTCGGSDSCQYCSTHLVYYNTPVHPVYCKCRMPQSIYQEYPYYYYSDDTTLGFPRPFPNFTFNEESQYYISFQIVPNSKK